MIGFLDIVSCTVKVDNTILPTKNDILWKNQLKIWSLTSFAFGNFLRRFFVDLTEIVVLNSQIIICILRDTGTCLEFLTFFLIGSQFKTTDIRVPYNESVIYTSIFVLLCNEIVLICLVTGPHVTCTSQSTIICTSM